MQKLSLRDIRSDFSAKALLIVYAALLVMHWPLSPLFMDIYYHLHTAWGFTQAGGYSGWDFWQYAPLGRPHIYPPLMHIILALLMKLGISTVALAKCSEIFIPLIFLCAVSYFLRSNFNDRFWFYSMVMLGSSFSFLLSLINHLPATLALILGLLSLDQLLKKNALRGLLLLTLTFYTHTGVSLFFALVLAFFALMEKDFRKISVIVLLSAIILSLPMLIKQALNLGWVTLNKLNEVYYTEFKTLDYILAGVGVFLAWRDKKYRLFLCLFLASFLFLVHIYRFFSAEGFLPIIFLSGICLTKTHEFIKSRRAQVSRLARFIPILAAVYALLISPTVLLAKKEGKSAVYTKFYKFDSAFLGMVFPERNQRIASQTLWYPTKYMDTVSLIRQNSRDNDIIYSRFNVVAVCLAALSGRPTSGGMLTEVRPAVQLDPIVSSKLFIATKEDTEGFLNAAVSRYGLKKIGEGKLFMVYRNGSRSIKALKLKASVPFGVILPLILAFLLLFFKCEKGKK